jgi:hypothetical protein
VALPHLAANQSEKQFCLPDWNAGTTKVEKEHPKKHPTKTVQDLNSMSIDELWDLHQKVAATLVAKITAEKEVIEDRLRLLNQARSDENENNRAR